MEGNVESSPATTFDMEGASKSAPTTINSSIRDNLEKVNTLDKNSSNVKFSHKQPAYVFSKGQIYEKQPNHLLSTVIKLLKHA